MLLSFLRFFGRISQSQDGHDEDTLAAIRETVNGLKGISVERIWLEMKRIVVGNYAPRLLAMMYDLGVAQNIGRRGIILCIETAMMFSQLSSKLPRMTFCVI